MDTTNYNNSSKPIQKYLTDKKFFVDSLKSLKEQIEATNTFHQIEILRILKDNDVEINENKNGVFINLTYVDSSILDKIYKYLSYVNKQEEFYPELLQLNLQQYKSILFVDNHIISGLLGFVKTFQKEYPNIKDVRYAEANQGGDGQTIVEFG
jgi:hypothetical protein